jgi:hypothetical protein
MSAESGLSAVFKRSRLQPTCKFLARQFYCREIVLIMSYLCKRSIANEVRIHSADQPLGVTVKEPDQLTGDPVLTGWSMPISDLFMDD